MSDAEFLTHAARMYPGRTSQLVSTLTSYLFSDLRPQVDPTISKELPGTIHGIFDGLHVKELPLMRVDESGVARLGACQFAGNWEAFKRISLGTIQSTFAVGNYTVTSPIRRKVIGLQTEGIGERRNTVTTAAIFSDGSGVLMRKKHDGRTQELVESFDQSVGTILIGGKEIPLNIALGDFIARTADFHYGTDYTKWLHSRTARS